MAKIIVANKSGKSDAEAMRAVAEVMAMGRISDNGRAYCFVTTFKNGLAVVSTRRKASDSFVVYDNQCEG